MPAKPLTARSVEGLKPDPERRLEVPDPNLPGLYLVVQPSGAKGWAVRYRADGRPRKMTIGRYPALGLAQARDEARKALRAVELGEDPGAEKVALRAAKREDPDRDKVRGVARDFLAKHASKNRSAAEVDRIFAATILPAIGDRDIREVGRRDILDMLDTMEATPAKAAKAFAYTRRFFAWALERDIIPSSPCAGIRPPAQSTPRERVLADSEVREIWAACEAVGWPWGPFTRFLVLTAQRRTEVATMRWADVREGVWTIPAAVAKNGREHRVPLSRAALAILTEAPRLGEHVFTTTGSAPVSGFSKAKRRLDAAIAAARGKDADGMPAWTLHDLRRTAATGLGRTGANVPVIERTLNHVSGTFAGIVATYQRYDHEQEVREALERWAGLVDRIVEGGSANVVALPVAKHTE